MGWRGTAPARRDGQRQIPFALKDEPMDTLVTMALVGTAQQPDKNIGTGTPIDTLTAGFSRREMERRILLAAGTWAIYRQTGKAPGHLPTAPEPAAPETLRTCAPALARLIEDMLAGTHDDLLPEALERMEKAGLHRPPAQKLPGRKARLSSAEKYCVDFELATRPKRGSGLKEPGSWRRPSFVQRHLKHSALDSRQTTKASSKRL